MGLRECLHAAAPTRRVTAAVTALALTFAALAVLVAHGTFTRLDQFSLDHLMPWLNAANQRPSGSEGLYRPFAESATFGDKLCSLYTYPCSVLISGLLVLLVAIRLWRRFDPVTALVLPAAWVIGNGIEVVGKHFLVRPPLYGLAYGVPTTIVGLRDAFPSGHTIRGFIVAASVIVLVRQLWPALSRLVLLAVVAAWLVLVGPALVVEAAHTITDVLGGILIGAGLSLLLWRPLAPVIAGDAPWPGRAERQKADGVRAS